MAMTNSIHTTVTVHEPDLVSASVSRSHIDEQGLVVTVKIGNASLCAFEYPDADHGVSPEAFADMLVRLVATIRLEAVALRAELADALP